jgi:hypothetical protein
VIGDSQLPKLGHFASEILPQPAYVPATKNAMSYLLVITGGVLIIMYVVSFFHSVPLSPYFLSGQDMKLLMKSTA